VVGNIDSRIAAEIRYIYTTRTLHTCFFTANKPFVLVDFKHTINFFPVRGVSFGGRRSELVCFTYKVFDTKIFTIKQRINHTHQFKRECSDDNPMIITVNDKHQRFIDSVYEYTFTVDERDFLNVPSYGTMSKRRIGVKQNLYTVHIRIFVDKHILRPTKRT
jgi:hypothetical protein